MNFGERVHLIRRRKKMTQQELGDAIGVSKMTIFRIEKGDFSDTMGQHIAKMARVLNVSGNYLLGLQEEPEPLEKVEQKACVYQRDQGEELLPMHSHNPRD